MKAQRKMTREQLVELDTPIDYTENMFKDGNNRTANDAKARKAPVYDEAAHTMDPDISGDVIDLSAQQASDTTFHSRDGSDAAGLYDEDGGSLGGNADELDSLEAGATPVDKNPRMK